MPASNKGIKTRIKSIRNIKKVTRAMELVSASKMRRAIRYVLATRDYSDLAWKLLMSLKRCTDPSLHSLLHPREVMNKVLLVVFTSNRGLCGGYNLQVIQKAVTSIEKHPVDTDLIIVGKKGRILSYRWNKKIVADFPKEDVITQIHEIFPISRIILSEYIAGHYDRVFVAYTDFVSSLHQVARVRQILPIIEEDLYIGRVRPPGASPEPHQHQPSTASNTINQEDGKWAPNGNGFSFEFVFEPSASEVLESLMPRLIEIQLYQAYLEANASEHAARMLAMHNASDEASKLLDDLIFTFNQERQATITKEISEISAGKAVIE